MGSDASTQGPHWIEPWSLAQGELEARALFERTFGHQATGVWSSPGRVILMGEHTDYNAGATLATVTPHRMFVAARARDDGLLRIVEGQSADLTGVDGVWERHLDDLAPEGGGAWHVYAAGVAWALRERGYDGPGLDMAATSCIPVASGLAGASALAAGTAQAIDHLWRLALSGSAEGRIELAEVCYDAQNRYIGFPFGGVDYHTALRCREGDAIALEFSSVPPEASIYPLSFREYGLGLLVTRTAQDQHLSDPSFSARADECRAAADALGVPFIGDIAERADALERLERLEDEVLRRRARHIVTEIRRVRSIAQELSGVGPAHDRFTQIGLEMYRSHASLEVEFAVSSPAQNRAVDAAFSAGALGARMFGVGLGGSTVALVRRAQAEATARAIQDTLTAAGDPVPRFLLV